MSRKKHRIGDVLNGRVWSGDDYGFQTRATHEKLKRDGELRLGSSAVRRIGQALNKAVDKVPGAKGYIEGVAQEGQRQQAVKDRLLQRAGVDTSKPDATSRAIEGVSRATNVNKTVVAGAAAAVQAGIEAKVGIDSLRVLPKAIKASNPPVPPVTRQSAGKGVTNRIQRRLQSNEVTRRAQQAGAIGDDAMPRPKPPGPAKPVTPSKPTTARVNSTEEALKDLVKNPAERFSDSKPFNNLTTNKVDGKIAPPNPSGNRFMDAMERMRQNKRRLADAAPQSPETPKTAGRKLPDDVADAVKASQQRRRGGRVDNPRYVVEGNYVDLKPEDYPVNQSIVRRQRDRQATAGRLAQSLDYVQTKRAIRQNQLDRQSFRDVQIIADIRYGDGARGRRTSHQIGLNTKVKDLPIRYRKPAQRSVGFGIGRGLDDATKEVTDGKITINSPKGRIRSRLAGKAANRAKAKSNVPSRPANAPLGGFASDPNAPGIPFIQRTPDIPNEIEKRFKKMERKASKAKKIDSRSTDIDVDEDTGLDMYDQMYADAPAEFRDSERMQGQARAAESSRRYLDEKSRLSAPRQDRVAKRIAERKAAGVPIGDRSNPYGARLRHVQNGDRAYGEEGLRLQRIRDSVTERLQFKREIQGMGFGIPDDAKHVYDTPLMAAAKGGKTPKVAKPIRDRSGTSKKTVQANIERNTAEAAAHPHKALRNDGTILDKTLPGDNPAALKDYIRNQQQLANAQPEFNYGITWDNPRNPTAADYRRAVADQKLRREAQAKGYQGTAQAYNELEYQRYVEERAARPRAPITWHPKVNKADPPPAPKAGRIAERIRKGKPLTDAEKKARTKAIKSGQPVPPEWVEEQGVRGSKTQALNTFREDLERQAAMDRRGHRRRPGTDNRGRALPHQEFRYDETDGVWRFKETEKQAKLRRDLKAAADRTRTIQYEEVFDEFVRAYPDRKSAEQAFAETFGWFDENRVKGGKLKTDNAAGKESVSRQFRQAKERSTGRRINPRKFRSQSPGARTVPIGETVLDKPNATLNQPKGKASSLRSQPQFNKNRNRIQDRLRDLLYRGEVKLKEVMREANEDRIKRNSKRR